ncbi:MAG: DNA-binding protein [Firmicutes bacterium]|jgi:predicted DNA-binding protein with PD1-like motif|nr:DNA-binding protein [Bacillota bacterium]
MSLVDSSKAFTLDKVLQVKVTKDADLLAAIKEAVEKNGIDSAVILGGIGALKKATFRNVRVMPPDFLVSDEHRLYMVVENPLELVSLTGWVARRNTGGVEVHAHFSASYVDGDTVRTAGGHLSAGTEALIKVVVTLGVLKETQKASIFPPHGQWDVDLD